MKTTSETRAAGMSDEAVEARTGKNWKQWFSVLDAAGARKMNHQQIVAYLSGKFKVGPWWQQMVTVAYEQSRGMREKHQTARGYSVSVSRTMGVPLSTLYKSWQDEKLRGRWLMPGRLEIRKATHNKSLRITWRDKTNVEVNFYSRGNGKSQVAAQHNKLPDAKTAARMKACWSRALDRLKKSLEA